jgi:hypothetical protein
VLHGSCPAVDELPAEQAPGARHFSPVVHELATALRELRREGPGRLPVPPVVRRYDIARSAEALTAVYEQVLAAVPARRRSPARTAPTPVPPPQGRAAALPAASVSLPDPARSPDPSPLSNR